MVRVLWRRQEVVGVISDASKRDGPVRVLSSSPDFRRLWVGQALSNLGTAASGIAYVLLALDLTASPAKAGAVATSALVSRFAWRLIAGVVVDRRDRRRIMIVTDVVRAMAALSVAISLVEHKASWPLLMSTAAVEGAAGAFFGASQLGALKTLVSPAELHRAVVLNQVRSYTGLLLGPALGGLFYGLAHWLPFAFDSATFAFSAVFIYRIRSLKITSELDKRSESSSKPRHIRWAHRLVSDIFAGVRFVADVSFLRALVVLAPLMNLGFDGALFAAILILRGTGVSGGLLGSVQGTVALGGLLGTMLASRAAGRLHLRRLAVATCWLSCIGVLLVAVFTRSWLVGVAFAVIMIATPIVDAQLTSYQVLLVPNELQGRVASTMTLAAQTLSGLAPLLAGVLVARTSPPVAIGTFALVFALAGVFAQRSHGLSAQALESERDDT